MKDFFKRWWEGVKNIEPKQQLEISIISQFWQVIGILVADVYIFYTEHLYFFIFLVGVTIGILWKFYITIKTYKNLKEDEINLKKMMEEVEKNDNK